MMPQIKRILYTTDLSPNSGYVLRYAVNSAKKHGAKLIVFHVIEELSPTAKAIVESHLDGEKLIKISEEKIAYTKDRILKRLQALCKKELNSNPEAEGLFESIEVVEGYPADEILGKADEINCDAIIMGTHSKGFLKHGYFGSTPKKVLRRVRKPVFIIPLPEGETDITINDR
jgi:nucleotide-binding universal stress UspA family protein